MDTVPVLSKLKQKILNSQLPADVLEKLNEDLTRIELLSENSQYGAEVDRQIHYVEFVNELPWNKRQQDILDLGRARQILDKNHYGLERIKDRVLEYISVLILNKQQGKLARQPILAFVGLVGSGKTSMAFSIAEAVGRPIVRIPFGGLGSALQLRGESRIKPEAEPGFVMRALRKVGAKNPVILLDELDRVAQDARNDIMGVLVEMLDPEQNASFLDHYIAFPFDLSEVLFIATANNISNIATAVLDRLELIEMPFYTDQQKVIIGKDFLLPEALTNAGLSEKAILVDPQLWPSIVRPLGFDGGIRSLKRNIDAMVGKVARKVVEGNAGPFKVTQESLKEYLPS